MFLLVSRNVQHKISRKCLLSPFDKSRFLFGTDSLFRVHEERRRGEEDEDDAADERDGSDRDPLGDHTTAENRQTGAQEVAEKSGQDDGRKIFSRGQDDGGQLRSIAPLGQEGHGQRLKENFGEEKENGPAKKADRSAADLSFLVAVRSFRVGFFLSFEVFLDFFELFLALVWRHVPAFL